MSALDSMEAPVVDDRGVPLFSATVTGCGDSAVSDEQGRVVLKRYVEAECTVRVECYGVSSRRVFGPPTAFGAAHVFGPNASEVRLWVRDDEWIERMQGYAERSSEHAENAAARAAENPDDTDAAAWSDQAALWAETEWADYRQMANAPCTPVDALR
jgi:hypothetical protein